MAPKKGATFTCSACGAAYTKWAGKCDACGAWNSIVEEAPLGAGPKPTSKGRTIPLTDLATEEAPPPRASSGIGELDRVLGGGLVPASAILVGGDPGIGKSTLLLQAAASFARRGLKCMYISGEEAAAQVRMRAQRLNLTDASVQLGAESIQELLSPRVTRVREIHLIVHTCGDDHLQLAEEVFEAAQPIVMGYSGPNMVSIVEFGTDEPKYANGDLRRQVVTKRYRITYQTDDLELSFGVFHRRIEDLIETVDTGTLNSDGARLGERRRPRWSEVPDVPRRRRVPSRRSIPWPRCASGWRPSSVRCRCRRVRLLAC